MNRLQSTNSTHRMESLVTLRYIFDFKYKTRRLSPLLRRNLKLTVLDFHDNNGMMQVITFAIQQHETLLTCLLRSIDEPELTRLTIQNITFLMRTIKRIRLLFYQNELFKE